MRSTISSPPADLRLRIRFEGAAHLPTAYSMVNRQWVRAFESDPTLSLARSARVDHSDSDLDCCVHHDFSVDFGRLAVPEARVRIAVRPWDFGPYPPRWARHINQQWSALAVYTEWGRLQAERGGVNSEKIGVVSLGVDPEVYRPIASPLPLATDKHFRFLFVGAPVLRKGMDVLLDAYSQAFDACDDVVLVVKANAKDLFYQGVTLAEEVRTRAQEAGAPEILVLDDYLSDGEMAGLYAACQLGVFPYRAESFGLPILEAMACGTPCLVPRFGACLDYCDDDTALLLPVQRIRAPVGGRRFAFNTLGFEESVDSIDFCEPDARILAEHLRAAYEGDHAALGERGRRAFEHVRRRFDWAESARALARLATESARREAGTLA